jgi:hypothetical protein
VEFTVGFAVARRGMIDAAFMTICVRTCASFAEARQAVAVGDPERRNREHLAGFPGPRRRFSPGGVYNMTTRTIVTPGNGTRRKPAPRR